MKNQKKKGKGFKKSNPKNMRCPNCSRPMVLRSSKGIYKDNTEAMLYVCAGYPGCDTYARVHSGTEIPMGVPANGALRALRDKTHKEFDKIHKTGIMCRKDAYAWLAGMLNIPMSETHIGDFSEYYCNRTIEESKKLIANINAVRSNKRPLMRGGGNNVTKRVS